jgi:hypothetical protein
MKFNHFAAISAFWLPMLPGYSSESTVKLNAPVQEWDVTSYLFVSAEACQEHKHVLETTMKDTVAQKRSDTENRWRMALAHSECVSLDDPRLKSN